MRIGIDATCLPSAIAGAGRYIIGLLNGLAEISTEHDFFVFIKHSDRLPNLPADASRLQYISIPWETRPTRLIWELAGARSAIGRHKLDVWHAPHYVMPLGGDASIVVTLHDMAFFLYPELFSTSKRGLFRWAAKRAVSHADHIIATSHATRDEAVNLLGLQASKATVIHHGVDPAFAPESRGQDRSPAWTHDGVPAPYILTIGTTDIRKNLHTLIDAYRLLVERDNIAEHLVVAGQPGTAHEDLIHQIDGTGLAHRIHVTGYVDESDLPGLYSTASLYVGPSVYEGFGFPALEAIACGTPVVASPMPSMMETGANPHVVYRVKDSFAWYESISRALAKSHSGDWQTHDVRNWAAMAEETVAVYEASTGKPAGQLTAYRHASCRSAKSFHTDGVADAVLKTITYADLFDYPLDSHEIQKGMIGSCGTVEQIHSALQTLVFSGSIEARDGLYGLKERSRLFTERAQRNAQADTLYRSNQISIARICTFPFVRMVSLSGAIAHRNCTESSDVDLFMVVASRRLWTVYLLLAVYALLVRKRELLCMNYLIGDTDYEIADQDLYTALQISALRPIFGWDHYRRFALANSWVQQYMPQWNGHSCSPHPFSGIELSRWSRGMKRSMELILRLPFFGALEWVVHRFYSRRILNSRRVAGNEGIRLTRNRIKLHTNDHSRRIQTLFESRYAQVISEVEPPQNARLERQRSS